MQSVTYQAVSYRPKNRNVMLNLKWQRMRSVKKEPKSEVDEGIVRRYLTGGTEGFNALVMGPLDGGTKG